MLKLLGPPNPPCPTPTAPYSFGHEFCENVVGSSWSVIPHRNFHVQLEANKSRALLTTNHPFHETQAKKALDGHHHNAHRHDVKQQHSLSNRPV